MSHLFLQTGCQRGKLSLPTAGVRGYNDGRDATCCRSSTDPEPAEDRRRRRACVSCLQLCSLHRLEQDLLQRVTKTPTCRSRGRRGCFKLELSSRFLCLGRDSKMSPFVCFAESGYLLRPRTPDSRASPIRLQTRVNTLLSLRLCGCPEALRLSRWTVCPKLPNGEQDSLFFLTGSSTRENSTMRLRRLGFQ